MSNSRNPYFNEAGPKLVNSVAAFVDILGYRDITQEAVEAGSVGSLLTDLYEALQVARTDVDPNDSDDTYRSLLSRDLSAFRSFTDNIVIGYPIADDAENELGLLFWDLSLFQMDQLISRYSTLTTSATLRSGRARNSCQSRTPLR